MGTKVKSLYSSNSTRQDQKLGVTSVFMCVILNLTDAQSKVGESQEDLPLQSQKFALEGRSGKLEKTVFAVFRQEKFEGNTQHVDEYKSSQINTTPLFSIFSSFASMGSRATCSIQNVDAS